MKNEKLKNGSTIMIMKAMKKKRNALNIGTVRQESGEARRRAVMKKDLEAQTTHNAYSENYGVIIIDAYNDDEITDKVRDARKLYNKTNSVPYDVQEETEQEFDRRQYQICKQLGLKYPSRKYDRKYAEEMED